MSCWYYTCISHAKLHITQLRIQITITHLIKTINLFTACGKHKAAISLLFTFQYYCHFIVKKYYLLLYLTKKVKKYMT